MAAGHEREARGPASDGQGGAWLAGWGRLAVPGREVRSEDLAGATRGAHLTRGLGRSYGDSSLPAPGDREVVATPLADRLLGFDAETGLLTAEAGVTLRQLRERFLERGWWPPVVPGTQFVTLGGMVAADIHGKNHHVDGTFGRHVEELVLRLADDRIVACSRATEPELFRATLGGMGLTGHILEVSFRMERVPSPWIYSESERIEDLDSFLTGLARDAAEWPFTVGWLDTMASGARRGRGILLRGRWAEPQEAPAHSPPPKKRLAVPFGLPSALLCRPLARLFNSLYFAKHPRRPKRGVVHPESFFFPLDVLLEWNRIYGRQGFTQYQCVVPEKSRPGATRRVLETLEETGAACFLCVLKDCGDEGEGLLSFPRPGISLALDLPATPRIQETVDALDKRVIEVGGRIYLAKDRFTRGESYRRMDPRVEAFESARRRWDPDGRLRSAQSARMFDPKNETQ